MDDAEEDTETRRRDVHEDTSADDLRLEPRRGYGGANALHGDTSILPKEE